MGIDKIIGFKNAIPNNPNFDFTFTHFLLRFENTFRGFLRLNKPVFNLNQFQNLNNPELKNINTMMPNVPEEIPNNKDSQKFNSSLRIKNGTVIANLKDAMRAAISVSSQVVSIIILYRRLNHPHLQFLV
jgi:hypothetical protein